MLLLAADGTNWTIDTFVFMFVYQNYTFWKWLGFAKLFEKFLEVIQDALYIDGYSYSLSRLAMLIQNKRVYLSYLTMKLNLNKRRKEWKKAGILQSNQTMPLNSRLRLTEIKNWHIVSELA